MKVAVAGTGYVGLVTAVCLAEIGHEVTCVDVDQKKIECLQAGKCPIYEPELENLMHQNKERLTYTLDYQRAYQNADVIFVGVGTPERYDGSANLDYVYTVCRQIKETVQKDTVVVIKSTVPIGTNDELEKWFNDNSTVHFYIVSNPEFLAQGTAVHDTLYPARIVVGVQEDYSKEIMAKLYYPLTVAPYLAPYLEMDRKSAEMVKYASNDFLALKISYINEIANFCEKIGADIERVTQGMSYDKRIGDKFLNAGIGYGGSCFPKDTKALHWLSQSLDCELKTIKACIEVNKNQRIKLFEKARSDFDNQLNGKKVAILGLSFKPNTDDLREAPSIDNVRLLLDYGAIVHVYDPIAMDNFRRLFQDEVFYFDSIDQAIKDTDMVFIMTEAEEFRKYDLNKYRTLMKTPRIYDGRNCYDLIAAEKAHLYYYSIGRRTVDNG